MWLLIAWPLVNLIVGVTADAFCSVEEMKVAAQADREIAVLIDKWYKDVKLYTLSALVMPYLQEHERMKHEDYAEIVYNPLHAFQIIRRIVITVPEIQSGISKSLQGQSFSEELESIRQKSNLSLTDDLEGAAGGIIRLQMGQLLFASDLVQGKIHTYHTSSRLSLYDCIFIATTAKQHGEFNSAAEWAECAQDLAEELTDPYAQATISLLLKSITISHDEAPHNAEAEKVAARRFPLDIRGSNKTVREHREIEFDAVRNKIFDRNNWWNQDKFSYEASLCRGERYLTAEEESQLYCSQAANFHPYFFIQPVKLEYQSLDPLVVNVHDVIRNSDIELIKTMARELLHRSVVGGANGEPEESSYRISKTAWLEDFYSERIERISRRIGLLVGMNTNTFAGDAEPFQVVNYGIGGQYYHHHDFLVTAQDKDKLYNNVTETGDRIATFLIYLSDVTLGGATAFLSSGVAVKPVKGTGTFWYNLYSDGQGNTKTFHAGCPVVYGSKWIANKWFREKGQMFKKPCELSGGSKQEEKTEE